MQAQETKRSSQQHLQAIFTALTCDTTPPSILAKKVRSGNVKAHQNRSCRSPVAVRFSGDWHQTKEIQRANPEAHQLVIIAPGVERNDTTKCTLNIDLERQGKTVAVAIPRSEPQHSAEHFQ